MAIWCCSSEPPTEEERKEKEIPFYDEGGRKVRDVLFLAIWIVCWLALFGISIWAFSTGNAKRVLYGSDYTGTVCDGNDRSGLKYLTYPRMNEDVLAAVAKIGSSSELLSNLDSVKFYGVCVSTCPMAGDYVCNLDGVSALREEGFNTNTLSATDGLITDTKATNYIESVKSQSLLSLMDSMKRAVYNGCWANYLDTRSIFYRCLPIYGKNETRTVTCTEPTSVDANDPRCQVKSVTRTTTTTEPAQDNVLAEKLDAAASMWGRWMGDVANAWHVIFVSGFVMAMVFGFGFTFVIKYLAGCVVWSIVTLMIAASLAVTFLCYVKAGLIPSNYMATIESVASSETSVPSSYLQSSTDNKQYFKWGAGIMSIFTVLLVLITVAMIKRIRVAINILKASTKVLASIPFLTLWPFFTVFFVVVVVGVWITTSVFIATMSTKVPTILNTSETAFLNTSETAFTVGNQTLSLTELDTKDVTTVLNIFNFFMFLWTNQVVQGVGIMTIAGAVCELYWRRENASPPRFPVLSSYVRTMKYNLGTICFGGFIIAVVQLIRACILYVEQQLREANQNSRIVRVIMCVMKSYLWCLEKCLKAISKNAFIWSAMYGHSFCHSAIESFKLVLNNFTYVAILSSMSFVVSLLGKVSVTALCTLVAFAWLEFDKGFQYGGDRALNSIWLPLLLSTFLAYFIASCFFYVYDMVIDTMMMCFIRDMDLVEKKLLDELKMNRLNPALSKIVKVGSHAEDGEGDKEAESAPAAAV